MADIEYDFKIEEMQKYLPFLEGLIKNLKSSKNEKREVQLIRIERLYNILVNKDKRLNIDILEKCESAILKMSTKIEKDSATSSSVTPANEVPRETMSTDSSSLDVEKCCALFNYLFPNHDTTVSVQQNEKVPTVASLAQNNVAEATKPKTLPLLTEVLPALSLTDINNLLDIAKNCNAPDSGGNAKSNPELIEQQNSGYPRVSNPMQSAMSPSVSPSSDFESIRRKLAASLVNSSIIERNFDCPPSPLLQSERNDIIDPKKSFVSNVVSHNTSKLMSARRSDPRLKSTTSTHPANVRDNSDYPPSPFLQSEDSRTDINSTHTSLLDPFNCPPSPFINPQNEYGPIDVIYKDIPKPCVDPRLRLTGTCGSSAIVKGTFLQSNESRTAVRTTYPSLLDPLNCPPSPFLNPQNAYSPIDVGYKEIPKLMDPRLRIVAVPSLVSENCATTVHAPMASIQGYRSGPMALPRQRLSNTQGIPSLMSLAVETSAPNVQNVIIPSSNKQNEVRQRKVYKPQLIGRVNKKNKVGLNLFRKEPERFVAKKSTSPNIAEKNQEIPKMLKPTTVQTPALSCLDKMYRNDAYDVTINRSIKDFKIPKIKKTVAVDHAVPSKDSNDKEIKLTTCDNKKEENISAEIETKGDKKTQKETVKTDSETMCEKGETVSIVRPRRKSLSQRVSEFEKSIWNEDKITTNETPTSAVPIGEDKTPTCSTEISEVFNKNAEKLDLKPKETIPCARQRRKSFSHRFIEVIPKKPRRKSLSQQTFSSSSIDDCKKIDGQSESKKEKVIGAESNTCLDPMMEDQWSSSSSTNECKKSDSKSENPDLKVDDVIAINLNTDVEPMVEDQSIIPQKQRRKSVSLITFSSNGMNQCEKSVAKSEKPDLKEEAVIAKNSNADGDPIMEDQSISIDSNSNAEGMSEDEPMSEDETVSTINCNTLKGNNLVGVRRRSLSLRSLSEMKIVDIAITEEEKAIISELVPVNEDETGLNHRTLSQTTSINSDTAFKKPVTNKKEVAAESSNSTAELIIEGQVSTTTSEISDIIMGSIESESTKTDAKSKILTKSLCSNSLSQCETIKLEGGLSTLDEESSLITEPMCEDVQSAKTVPKEDDVFSAAAHSQPDSMSDEEIPLSDILKGWDQAGARPKSFSHADVKSGTRIEEDRVAEKFNSDVEPMSEDDTATTNISTEHPRRSLPQREVKSRTQPSASKRSARRSRPSTIINCEILKKNIVKGTRRKRSQLPSNAVIPKKRKSPTASGSLATNKNKPQECSVSSTTALNEDENKMQSKNDNKVSQEDYLAAGSSKKYDLSKDWIQGLLNPSAISTNTVLGMLEKVLDTEKFNQVKTILESDEPKNEESFREETLPVTTQRQSAPPANNRKKTELDRLNEDIREMFIRDEVLSANGRRGCTLKKDKITEEENPIKCLKRKSKGLVPAATKTKLSPQKQNQKSKSPSKIENMEPRTAAKAKSSSVQNVNDAECHSGRKKSEDDPEKDPDEEILFHLVVGKVPEDGIETKNTIKNINPKMHPLSKYRNKCVLCGVKVRYLASHYVNHHHCEVLNSRLPPGVQERLEADGGKTAVNTGQFPNNKKTPLFEYVCPFCETKLTFHNHSWLKHFVSHTGEYISKCSTCGYKKNKLQEHISKCPGSTVIAIPSPQKEKNVFHAYICDLCNYIQLNRQNIVDHLVKQHHCYKEQITQIVLLNLDESEVDIGPPLLEPEISLTITEGAKKLKRPMLQKKVVVKLKKLKMEDIKMMIRESKTKIEEAMVTDKEAVLRSSKSEEERKGTELDVKAVTVACDDVCQYSETVKANERTFKNIHSEMHTLSKYATSCSLCAFNSSYLATHYLNFHKSEVLTSRLPPDVQERFLRDSAAGNTVRTGRTHWFTCPFCDLQKSLSPRLWIDHLSIHTGEYSFRCSNCSYVNSKMTTMTEHIQKVCPNAHVIREIDTRRGKKVIFGFICNLCNYIQMNYNHVVLHLKSQHNCSEEVISTIALINFTSPDQKDDVHGNQDRNISENSNVQLNSKLGIDSTVVHSQKLVNPIKDQTATNSEPVLPASEGSFPNSGNKPNVSHDDSFILISDDEDDSVRAKPAFFSKDYSNYEAEETPIDDDENWEDIDSPPSPLKTNTTANLNVEENKAKNTKTVYPALGRLYASIVETTIDKSFESKVQNESSRSNISDTLALHRINELAYKTSNSGVRYHCLVESCSFPCTELLFALEAHLVNEHRDLKWNGHCDSCRRNVSVGNNLNVLDEFMHMQEFHIASNSTETSKERTKKTKPILKVRHLPGDSLSSFVGKIVSLKNGTGPSAATSLATPKSNLRTITTSNSSTSATRSIKTIPPQLKIASVSNVVVSIGGSIATTNVHTNSTSSLSQLKIANVSSAGVITDGANALSSHTVKCNSISIPPPPSYRIVSYHHLPKQIIVMPSAGLTIGGAVTGPTNSFTNTTSPLQIANVNCTGANNSTVSAVHGLSNTSSSPLKIASVSSAGVNVAAVNVSAVQNVNNITSMSSTLKIASVSSAGMNTGAVSNTTSMPSELRIASVSSVRGNTGVVSNITTVPSRIKTATNFSGGVKTGEANSSAAQGVSNVTCMPSPQITKVSRPGVYTNVSKESAAQRVSNIANMSPQLKIANVFSGGINTDGVNNLTSHDITNITPIPQLKIASVSSAAISAAPDANKITPPYLKPTIMSTAEGNIGTFHSTGTSTMDDKESRASVPKSTSSSIAQRMALTAEKERDPNSGWTVLKPWTQSRSIKSKVIVSRLLQKEKLLAFFKCMGNDCDFTTKGSTEMKTHLNTHKPQPDQTKHAPEWLECCYCNHSTAKVATLISHLIENHNTDIYQCPYCFYRTCEEYNVLVHLGNHHPVNDFMIYVCPGKKPDQTAEFNIAENRMMQNVKHITDKDRPKSSLPLVHGMYAKLNISTELFQCLLCLPNNTMVGKQQLLDHLMSQHNVTCYECVHCTFGTDNKLRMNTHMSNCHASNLLFCCVRLEMLKSTLNEQLYIYKELPNRTALVLLKRKVKDKYLRFYQQQTSSDNSVRQSVKLPTSKTVQQGKVDSIDQLPRSQIFGAPLYCSTCGYGSKVRMNLVRHFQSHAEHKTKIASTDPVNPAPGFNAPEKHFDRMTNLACSSNTKN